MDWNTRYDRADYLFGAAPAAFLIAAADYIPAASRVLCLADGEGRNSVYLAQQGHDVTAFDPALNALDKAARLAADKGVEVTRHQARIDDWDWSQTFDAVVGIFFQFVGPERRATLFEQIAQAVRPGGVLLIHGYAPRQVGFGTGGPSDARNMYTLDLLRDAFPGWEVLRAQDYEAEVDEGVGHSGRSALIDFVAKKPD